MADQVCPQFRKKFEEVSLSRRIVARRIEAIGKDLTLQFKMRVLSLSLDDSTDIGNTAQLIIFVRAISDIFEITEELLSMESTKGITTGKGLPMF